MIINYDIAQKALVFFLICLFAVSAVFFTQEVPAEEQLPEEAEMTALEIREGELKSWIGENKGLIPVLGLDYHVPKRKLSKRIREPLTLSTYRDAGLLRGYSLPPERLAFTPDGGHAILPVPLVPDAPRPASLVYRGNPEKKKIALTFDTSTGEEPMAREILNELTRLRAPATFFVCGSWCYKNEDTLREMVKRGYEVASHSWDHPWFTRVEDSEIVDQLVRTSKAVQEVCGEPIAAYFRPPYGAVDDRVKQYTGQCGYLTLFWNEDTRDWDPVTPAEQITARATVGASNGDIVIMHTHSQHTLSQLESIVNGLRDKGFELTTVSGVIK